MLFIPISELLPVYVPVPMSVGIRVHSVPHITITHIGVRRGGCMHWGRRCGGHDRGAGSVGPVRV